jgi:YHS domain-containing protein
MIKQLVLIAATLMGGLVWAGGPVDPINKDSGGLALKGYDAVAYFTEGKPVKGGKDFEYAWSGARWQFSSAANRDLFKANPEKYAPQNGGYCTWAVSKGYTASISPNAWKVVNGKLYLNHPLAKGKFEKDVQGAIARADENWPKIPKK